MTHALGEQVGLTARDAGRDLGKIPVAGIVLAAHGQAAAVPAGKGTPLVMGGFVDIEGQGQVGEQRFLFQIIREIFVEQVVRLSNMSATRKPIY